jgi:hypothetical protein
MDQIVVQNLKTLRRGPTKGREDDVVFLHMLLNYHLGPPDDQLPVQGPGATDFGPRTEAKVKKFQQVNKIDINTQFFMDGVVGPHTWAALSEPLMMKTLILGAPQLKLNPPTFPNFPGPMPPKPPLIPVPKLTLPPISVQSGVQFTVPFDGSAVTKAHSLQITATLIKKKDGKFRPEGQAGFAIVNTPGGTTDRTDLGFVAVVSTGDLPPSGDRVVWSIQAQAALLKSLTDRAGSGQVTTLANVDVVVFKKENVAAIKLTGQAGLVLELDTPGRDNNRAWEGQVGFGAFFGVTATFGEHEEPKK